VGLEPPDRLLYQLLTGRRALGHLDRRQLEIVGHRTLLQAWDFVPGVDFIDFMDRGVRGSTLVVPILSRNYLKSHYGRMEWQAALRTDLTKLIPVRVDDCPLEGLLATITYLDLVGVTDCDEARERLLTRLRSALTGRAKPEQEPAFPARPVIPGNVPYPVGTRCPTASQRQTAHPGQHRHTS
jgi:hypothetical protein